MAKTKVKLTLNGFNKLLEDIQIAGGNIKTATEKALTTSSTLLTQDIAVGAVEREIETDRLIQPKTTWNGNVASTEAGFELGSYDSKNPNSAYKAMFVEYGTGRLNSSKPKKDRKTNKGYNRGSSQANPFIRPAIEKDAAKIKRLQREALNNILSELK